MAGGANRGPFAWSTSHGDDPGGERVLDDAERWAGRVVAGLAAILAATLAWRAAAWNWSAVGDYGIMHLRTLDVGASETPLVGVYSRFGWNHPGPLIFYVLAPFVRLVGGGAQGMLLGAVIVNTAAIAAAIAVVRAAGRVATSVTAVVLAVVVVGLRPVVMMDPWNPYLVILPLLTTVLAAWRSLFGERTAAVTLVVAASFSIQGHVGTALVAGAMLAVGLAGLVRRAVVEPERRRHHVTTLALVAAVLVACWLAPIVEQLTSGDGNVSRLSDYFLNGDEEVAGLAAGLRILTHVLSVPRLSMSPEVLSPATDWAVPWSLIALVLAGVVCRRRRWASQGSLVALALLTSAVAAFSASRVSGLPYPYLFRWAWVAGAVTWMAVLFVVVSELRLRFGPARWSNVATLTATGALLAVALVTGPDMSGIYRWESAERASETLIGPSIEATTDQSGPGLFVSSPGADMALLPVLLREAGEAGVDLRTTSDLGFTYGDSRVIEPGDEAWQLVYATGADVERYRADPGFREVLAFDRLTEAEREELVRLRARERAGDELEKPAEVRLEVLGGYDDPVVMFVGTPSARTDEGSALPR